MKRNLLYSICCFFLFTTQLYGQQRTCGSTLQQWKNLSQQSRYLELYNKALLLQQSKTLLLSCDTIIIPVIVHVVYNTPEENISDVQVQSQIDALNEDFSALNANISEVPDVWKPYITDSKIRFCLANRTPDNVNSTGINRRYTSLTTFYALDSRIKYDTAGGANAWPASSYLNFWVCDLEGALGYAQFPGVIPEEDGVVFDFEAFGRTGTLNKKYNLGRTGSHEVGHWLELRHIWGDEVLCDEDDNIDDTPLQEKPTFGVPKFPRTDLCTQGDGIMFMNYMDYTDDKAMCFFTPNQVDTMRRYFELFRDSICFSVGNTVVSRLKDDLELLSIISPIIRTEQRCFKPEISIRNNGNDTVTNFQIIYNMIERTKRLYQWNGVLLQDSSINITLPDISGAEGFNILEVRIAETDSNNVNNYKSRSFKVDKENTAGCDNCSPTIYPNPVTNGSFCIKSCFTTSDELTIRIINMMGQKVLEFNMGKSNPGDVFPVNMGNQAKGIYVVQLINGEQSSGTKMIYLPGESNYSSIDICR